MSDSLAISPGSAAAKERGCTCPVIDNHHGEGFTSHRFGEGDGKEKLFWIAANCPLHGSPTP